MQFEEILVSVTNRDKRGMDDFERVVSNDTKKIRDTRVLVRAVWLSCLELERY